jgi:putative phosphoribosyl transferase
MIEAKTWADVWRKPTMKGIIEEVSLRDRSYVFPDRTAAGRLLARKLVDYKDAKAVVLAIPAGGVPVGAEIARFLQLPLDLVIVRKIQIPWNTEAGFGALAPDGQVFINKSLLRILDLDEEQVNSQLTLTRKNLEQREALFRGGRPYPDLQGKIAIVVDDGLASGYTMLAAVKFINRRQPVETLVAVPTGLLDTIGFIRQEIPTVVCLNIRTRRPFAVAAAYRQWYDVPDEEVLQVLKEFQQISN